MLPKKLKFVVHILIILLLLVSFAIMGVYVGYNYVITQEERFTALEASIEDGSFKVDMNTEGAIPFVIRTGDMTSDIADKLFMPDRPQCRVHQSLILFTLYFIIPEWDNNVIQRRQRTHIVNRVGVRAVCAV